MKLQKIVGKKILNIQIDTLALMAAREHCEQNNMSIDELIEKYFKTILIEKIQKELN